LNQFNEQAIRRLYRILRHDSFFTDARAIQPGGATDACISRTLLRSEDELVDWARKFNGRANLYVGRNPRNADGTVAHVTALSFDVDPIYDQSVGASPELVREVIERATRILHRYPCGHLAFTGNGALLVYPLADVLPYSKPFDFGYGLFIRRLAPLVDVAGRVKLDNLHDSERIIKLVGTLSVKGQPRLTEWLHTPTSGWEAASKRIVAEIRHHEKESERGNSKPRPSSSDPAITELLLGIDKATAGISRHSALVKVTSYFRARHSSEVTWKLLEDWNQRNNPPLEEARLRKEAGDVLRRFDEGTYTSNFTVGAELAAPKEITLDPNADIADFEKHIAARGSRPVQDVTFGYTRLDEMCGGIPRPGLTVVGALTKAGKSILSLNASLNNVLRNKDVTYFPTEMSKSDCMMRYAAAMMDIPFKEFYTGRLTAESQRKFAEFKEIFRQGKFNIVEGHTPSLADVASALEKKIPDLLVIDYVQHCALDSTNKTRSVEKFVIGLNDLVKSANVSCILVSQPHRPGKDFKTGKPQRITIHDMADSSIIEKEASSVILLHFDGEDEEGSRMRTIYAEVAAVRNGGELGETPLLMDKKTTRFYE
jgi:KaiC/GvpD/RAD55 family RecA-like ATPase